MVICHCLHCRRGFSDPFGIPDNQFSMPMLRIQACCYKMRFFSDHEFTGWELPTPCFPRSSAASNPAPILIDYKAQALRRVTAILGTLLPPAGLLTTQTAEATTRRRLAAISQQLSFKKP